MGYFKSCCCSWTCSWSTIHTWGNCWLCYVDSIERTWWHKYTNHVLLPVSPKKLAALFLQVIILKPEYYRKSCNFQWTQIWFNFQSGENFFYQIHRKYSCTEFYMSKGKKMYTHLRMTCDTVWMIICSTGATTYHLLFDVVHSAMYTASKSGVRISPHMDRYWE